MDGVPFNEIKPPKNFAEKKKHYQDKAIDAIERMEEISDDWSESSLRFAIAIDKKGYELYNRLV